MEVKIFNSYEQMSQSAADFVAAQLLLKPDSQMGLTAGNTPVGMYDKLVKLYEDGRISFAKASFYNLEEYIGLGREHKDSCYQYLFQHLISRVDANSKKLILPDGLASDILHESEKYDALFSSLPDGRLDMQIIGIGPDGHIGCNRPAEKLIASCHNVDFGPDSYNVIAMGMRSIMLSKRILLLANGSGKAHAVADMCGGKITTFVPATFLQLHPDVTVLLDREAAAEL